jgi:adenosine kinase
MNIAITGSIAYDYIMRYPGEFKEMLFAESLDHISVSFLVDEMTRHRGGIAANIAYTLALLGERPTLIGAAGQDFQEYRDALDQVGVDTSGVCIYPELFTASFFVSTDRRNSQIASFYTGAMARAREIDLEKVITGHVDLVVISPNDPLAMENSVAYCKSHQTPYMYDPSQQVARSEGDVLARGIQGAFMLIVNQYEFTALVSKTGLSKDAILGQVENVIVTLGDQGADIYTSGRLTHIPAVPEERIVDPTGVGDAFRAGILKGLAAGWPWEISGRVGALAAVYVLEERGTQNHSFSPEQFVTRFRKQFDDGGLLDSLMVS